MADFDITMTITLQSFIFGVNAKKNQQTISLSGLPITERWASTCLS